MHTERVTVSLPAEVAAAARLAVQSGSAPSVSAYVAGAVQARLAREQALATLTTLFGGPPAAGVLEVVRQDFGLPPRRAEAGAQAS